MGRPKKQSREPFWRSDRSCYYVQVGTRQQRLSPDKDEAWRLWHEFMAKPPVEREAPKRECTFVVEVLDAFLEWVQKNRAARTYAWYKENIQRFVDRIPDRLTVEELKPYHVTDAMADFEWANNTKNDFITCIKRPFSWAVDEERITRNPIERLKKPAREAREMAISPEEYATILEAMKTGAFRDLLELAWETGARVQELRKIEGRFVERGRIVFPPTKAKGKKYHRVIYLNERAQEIMDRLAAARPEGPIVLNSDGNEWNKNAINCVFVRLKEKLGVKYHLGAFRKGFATEGLKAGVDVITMAHLMGHRDPSMLSRVYAQVYRDQEYMAQSLNKKDKSDEGKPKKPSVKKNAGANASKGGKAEPGAK